MFGMRVSLHATWASFSSRPRYFQSERRLRRLRQWTEFITAASVQGTLRAITILATAVVPRATWANFSSRPRTLQTIRRLMRLRRPRTLQPIRRLMRLRRWTGALATVSVQKRSRAINTRLASAVPLCAALCSVGYLFKTNTGSLARAPTTTSAATRARHVAAPSTLVRRARFILAQHWPYFQDKQGLCSPSTDNDACCHACKARCCSASAVPLRAEIAI
jgi:hypothetical protein